MSIFRVGFPHWIEAVKPITFLGRSNKKRHLDISHYGLKKELQATLHIKAQNILAAITFREVGKIKPVISRFTFQKSRAHFSTA